MIESSFTPSSLSNYWNTIQLSTQFLPPRGQEFTSQRATGEESGTRESEGSRWALVVDDVSDVTEMLSALMTHAGYEVSTASCAPDAIALAREHNFDIVISD